MKLFSLKPSVHKFSTFTEFAKAFNVGSEDLIIVGQSTYKNNIRDINILANYLFPKNYGEGEPTDEMIDRILQDVKGKNYKRVIAIGGGSVLDIAKILTLENVTKSADVFKKTRTFRKDKELITIPTTCGTGSEVTFYSIAKIVESNSKVGVGMDEMYADTAVLIPKLLKGLPFKTFMSSSMDALIHAMESFVSPNSNIYTELFSEAAVETILMGYMKLIEKGKDHYSELLEDFLIASNYAGVAFANTGVGAVHALSYPLGGKYGVPHGEANYTFFVEVFNLYNTANPTGKIKYLNNIICEVLGIKNDEHPYEWLTCMLTELMPIKKARSYGMLPEEIRAFSDSVYKNQQRLLTNSYISLSYEDIWNVYNRIY